RRGRRRVAGGRRGVRVDRRHGPRAPLRPLGRTRLSRERGAGGQCPPSDMTPGPPVGAGGGVTLASAAASVWRFADFLSASNFAWTASCSCLLRSEVLICSFT